MDLQPILQPTALADLREEMPPVRCLLWRGATYEEIVFETMYPFDTLEQIKRLLCHHMRGDPLYLPKYLFVGVPVLNDADPTSLDTLYQPLDFLWYPVGTTHLQDAYHLPHPLRALTQADPRFVTAEGDFAAVNYESRSRTSLEHAFLTPRKGTLPVFHVFPFHLLYQSYRGPKPISDAEWNGKLAAYFPDLLSEGPFEPTALDGRLGRQIDQYITLRESTVDHLQAILEADPTAQGQPEVRLTGVLQMVLLWKTPPFGFQGCAPLFYPLRVTADRPYLRLLPAEGTAVTKLHVDGILPLPTLHDPRIITQWNKEGSPTPKIDCCVIKYVHRPAIESTPPLYGTIHVMNDGTMKLTLQPPKTVPRMDPRLDFRGMDRRMEGVLQGLPQRPNAYQIHELSTIFTLRMDLQQPRFTKERLQRRLPTFQAFFREIRPLPGKSPILSLRYKAISQYVVENEVFAFITLWSTKEALEGESISKGLLQEIQREFQISEKEATTLFTKWYQRKGEFVVENPEEGEISEAYHPGVDLHFYAQHPAYSIHVHRIDSMETYRRLYTLLGLLFLPDDALFRDSPQMAAAMDQVERQWDEAREAAEKKDALDMEEVAPLPSALEMDWDFMDDPVLAAMAQPQQLQQPPQPQQPQQPQAAQPAYMGMPQQPPQPQQQQRRPVSDAERRVTPEGWFIKRLSELDKRLFTFPAPKARSWAGKCQMTDDRQPVILTEDQYLEMRRVYRDDDLYWLVYPLQGQADPAPPAGVEQVTLMLYGSDTAHVNYLFCPRFFCLYDEIMVREKDLRATVDRDGNPKPPNTCPFCYGGMLLDSERQAKVVQGRTVIERKKKGPMPFPGFMSDKSGKHPDGMSLPCCFGKQQVLRLEDHAGHFKHLREYFRDRAEMQRPAPDAPEEANEANANEANAANGAIAPVLQEQEYYEAKLIEYGTLFNRLFGAYLLESNKMPAAGIFATAAPRFDKYFHQDSSRQMVVRSGIHLHLRPTAQGFVRLGVDNTAHESLLGLLAPLLNASSVIDVKERLTTVIQPRIFLNAHFGNLVLEFFDPAHRDFMPETPAMLMEWAETQLGVTMTAQNSYALLRVCNAYFRFLYFLEDPKQTKHLRHLQPFLAEPGLLTPQGIQLVVLEDRGANEKGVEYPIQVRCPLFGVSAERHRANDIAFLSRKMRPVGTLGKEYPHYELYVYTANTPAIGAQPAEHNVVKLWKHAEEAQWPEIVRQRVHEYREQCESSYRAMYTPQRDIAQDTILPISVVLRGSPVRPEGIIKDPYNHLVGVTFRISPRSPTRVILPVVDDGTMTISTSYAIRRIYLDWEDVPVASLDETLKYYTQRVQTTFSLYTGYRPRALVRLPLDRGDRVVAIQLENGVYVPVGPTENREAVAAYGLPTVEVEEFEAEVNKRLAGMVDRGYQPDQAWEEWIRSAADPGCGKAAEMEHRLSVRELDELYQQFRVMVSKWLTTPQRQGVVSPKKQIEDILFRDLPDYEKRKRLDILFSARFLSWFYPDDHWEMPALSLLRRDCQMARTPEGCTGSCRWKVDEGKGRCLLHVPTTTALSESGDWSVSTAELFTKRILDEIVRYPARRKQLFTKGVSLVSHLTQPLREGDQYILPENSATWLDLLRMEWMESTYEAPKYYEEQSREFSEEDVKEVERLPAEWRHALGESETLTVVFSDQPATPLVPLLARMGFTMEEVALPADTADLGLAHIKQLAKATNHSMGVVEFGEEKYEPFTAQFVKRRTELQHVTLFVRTEGRWGLVMEGEQTYVPTASLPQELRQRFEATKATIFLKPSAAPRPALPHTTSVPSTQQVLEEVKEKEPPLVLDRKKIAQARARMAERKAQEAKEAKDADEAEEAEMRQGIIQAQKSVKAALARARLQAKKAAAAANAAAAPAAVPNAADPARQADLKRRRDALVAKQKAKQAATVPAVAADATVPAVPAVPAAVIANAADATVPAVANAADAAVANAADAADAADAAVPPVLKQKAKDPADLQRNIADRKAELKRRRDALVAKQKARLAGMVEPVEPVEAVAAEAAAPAAVAEAAAAAAAPAQRYVKVSDMPLEERRRLFTSGQLKIRRKPVVNVSSSSSS